ncbi:hypothetical protein NKR19_g5508 [Coniochaeta hoffmannii]|uniref:Uncharacterized protein n=1 Tax=Coniochaeta hoffmannii TaxID=91930 RepID=A0AA38S5J1_9PEZI|nr:hypothetical protein NKR19_g5508 [Coniochaeta hoffmannii]
MMLLRPQSPSTSPSLIHTRKRKADSQPDSNERLSKRLSLLNLEQNGHRLYVPVEVAQRTDASSSTYASTPQLAPTIPASASSPSSPSQLPPQPSSLDDEPMHLDSTKHKVYIYSLDDELADEPPESSAADERVVFLPDIERHLRANRIPPSLLLRDRPDLDDLAAKQLVLYHVPSSISVPEEQDSVRKAIIEARQRVRERQEAEREEVKMRREAAGVMMGAVSSGVVPDAPMEDEVPEEDGDAMELD